MQFTQAFDLIISLVLIFFLFSTVCSGIMEFINLRFKRRNNYLYNSIKNFFNEEFKEGVTWADAIYKHPQIEALKKNKSSIGPSYIQAESFSQVIIDLVSNELIISSRDSSEKLDQEKLKKFEEGVESLNSEVNRKIKQLLSSFLNSSSSLTELKNNIQKWYDGYMDRLGGWFKRDSKIILLFISMAIAIGGNVNTIRLIDYFKKNEEERGKMVNLASEIIKESDSTLLNPNEDRALGALVLVDTLGLPIGWKSRKEVGLILTKHLLTRIDSLEKQRIDSLSKIEDKFCLIRSCDVCQPSTSAESKCKNALKCLTNEIGLRRTKCDTLFQSDSYQTLKKSYIETKNLYQSGIDSLSIYYEESLSQFKTDGVPSAFVKKATCDYNLGGNPRERFFTYLGWIISAIAGTQGASFWFELLVRFVNIRNNGIKPSKASG